LFCCESILILSALIGSPSSWQVRANSSSDNLSTPETP